MRVVSNAHPDAVSKKLDLLGLTHRQRLAVHGDARKYIIGPAAAPSPRYLTLPEQRSVDGLPRPVLLKRGHYLDVLERVWREESGTAPEPRSAAWLQRASRAYRWLRVHAPAEVERFRQEVEAYADELDRIGVRPETLGRRYAPSVVARYAAREILPLLLGLPLAAVGMVLHALPYQVLGLGVRLARPDADTEATYKLAGGIVIYPLAWVIEAWLVHRWGGRAWLVVFLLALLPCGFFALAWQARVRNVAREARGLLHFLARRGLHERLIERRRALADDIERLAARVPDAVLTGERS